MNKGESLSNSGEKREDKESKIEKLEVPVEKLDDVINSEEEKLENSVSQTKKEGIEILADSYQKVLDNKIKELRGEISLAEKKGDEETVLQKEQELRNFEETISSLEDKKITEIDIVDLEDEIKNLRDNIKIFEQKKDEKNILESESNLRQAEVSLQEKNKELNQINESMAPIDDILQGKEVISIKKVELEISESELETNKVKEETGKLVETELIGLKSNLEKLRGSVKDAEKIQDEKTVLEIENEIRKTEENIKRLNNKLSSEEKKSDLVNKIKEAREAIRVAEEEKDEAKVLAKEKEVHNLEDQINNIDKPEEGVEKKNIDEKVDNVATSQAIENESKVESGVISQEALDIFTKFSLSEKELREIPNFNNLSEAAQVLLAQTFSSNALERAQARSAKEKVNRATSKNKWINKLQSIKIGLFNSASIDKASSKEEKELGLEGHKEELTNLTGLYQETNLEGEMKEGQVEVSFVNLADYDLEGLRPEDKKNTEETFTAVNEAANKLAKMPKHWQDKFASKENRAKYKEALQDYKDRKAELAASLLPLDSLTRISKSLNDLEKKVNMIQFLTADPELEKEWKDMGKYGLVKFFTNLTNRENATYMGAGMATRAIATSFIAYAAIPATAAVFGAIRGYKRGEKVVRKKDEKKAKSEHIKDTNLFAQKEKVFNEITKFNKENNDPDSEKSFMENIIDKCVKDPAFIAKAKEMEGISKNSKEKFIPNRDADYVEQVYQSLDKNKLSEKEFKSLLYYSDKVSKLKELNSQINEQQDKSIDKKTEKSSDVSEKLEKLISKIREGKLDNINKDSNGQTELEKTLDMLSRRLNFSQDKSERDLINFGDIKERANNQATFYEILSKGRLVLIENKHNTETDVYKETEGQVQNFLSYIENKQGNKLTKERKKFFIKKAIEGASMGAVFAVAGSSLMQGASSIYEGASNLGGPNIDSSDAGVEAVSANTMVDSSEIEPSADVARNLQEDIADNKMAELIEMQQNELGKNINIDRPLVPDEIEIINSLNLPDSLEINSSVLEIINNNSIPFKEAILNNPNLLEAYDTIKDFTETILASVVKAGELTQEHLNISKLTEEYNLSSSEQNSLLEMLKSSKEELVEKIGDLRAISHTIEEGENFTQSLREILNSSSEHTKDAFIERVNEGYGILDEGEVISEVNREELLAKAVNRLSVEGTNSDSGVASLVYKGNVLKVNSETGQWDISQGEADFSPKATELETPEPELKPREGAPVEKIPSRPITGISTEKPFSEGASVNSLRTSDLENDGAEVSSVDGSGGAPVTPVEEIPTQEEVSSSPEPVNQEGAPVTPVEEPVVPVEEIPTEQGSGKGTIRDFLANLSEEQRQNLSEDQLRDLYEDYMDNLNAEEEANLNEGYSEVVDKVAEEQYEVAKILSKSTSFAKDIINLDNVSSDPEASFNLYGQTTSFAKELNRIVGEDNFYESLSSEQKGAYKALIEKIQALPDNSISNNKASSLMRNFMRKIIE